MLTKSTEPRPTNAIFADGSSKRPLAIHPGAIGVSYPTRTVRDRSSHELRDVVASDVAEIANGVAVLCVEGPLEHKSSGSEWSYWQTYEDLVCDFNLVLTDPSVSAVVLKFDSPGGECAGLNETVAIMQGMKVASGKPVIAYVDEACYSAGYALAMVADEIYLPESGGVGSIGVITAMVDVTKANEKQGVRVEVIASGAKKADGHPSVPLTDEAIARTRRIVDRLAGSFFDLVSSGRNLSTKTIAGFEAGTYQGQEAVDIGLADGVMSLQECLTFAAIEFSSRTRPNRAKKETKMPGKIADAKATSDATKLLAIANEALNSAKTEGARALAAARVLAAEEVVAKVKKTKTITTDTHEEEVDDGEEEAEKPADEGEEDGEEEEEEGEEEDAKASATASLLATARKITGKKSLEEVIGALHAFGQNSKKTSSLAAEVAKLRAEAEGSKVSALIASGMKAGKLAPAQRAWARTQSVASLKAYLDASPRMVHTVDDEHSEAKVESGQAGIVTAEMAKIWKKQGFAEKDFAAILAKMNARASAKGV